MDKRGTLPSFLFCGSALLRGPAAVLPRTVPYLAALSQGPEAARLLASTADGDPLMVWDWRAGGLVASIPLAGKGTKDLIKPVSTAPSRHLFSRVAFSQLASDKGAVVRCPWTVVVALPLSPSGLCSVSFAGPLAHIPPCRRRAVMSLSSTALLLHNQG